MKMRVGVVLIVLGALVAGSVQAGTVAYWRFEEGAPGVQMDRGGQPDGVYHPAALDNSGNGYELSVWNSSWAGYAYNANVGGPEVNGSPNTLSVKNTGGSPAMWTSSDDAIRNRPFPAFTVEATFKLENGGYRTIAVSYTHLRAHETS